MNICIGIISWFPDGTFRSERIDRCKKLLAQLSEIFPSVSIVIVAQNWREEIDMSANVHLLPHPKLGITQARQALRAWVLNSEYDYIITFDDDCVLDGTKEAGDRYLSALAGAPDGYTNHKNMFKLSAVSKSVFKQFEIPALSVENKTGLEDYAFFAILEKIIPEKKIAFDFGELKEVSRWIGDNYSCWDRQDIAAMYDKTSQYVKNSFAAYAAHLNN